MRRHAALVAPAVTAPPAPGGCSSVGSAQASGPRLSVSGGYIPLPSLPNMAAGHLVLRNDGDTPATLTGVSSPQAQSLTLHRSNASAMVDTPTVRAPAHGVVTFARCARHLMLTGLNPAPKLGARIELKLRFDDAAPVTVQATVRPLTYQPDQSGQTG